MSHFTVAVILKEYTEEALKKALQPFHEYECTGIEDEYVVWVDEHEEKLSEYENSSENIKKEYPHFTDYMLNYEEYNGSNIKNGRWGSKTNPNAKWDWWVVGGRWPNMILKKNGFKSNFSQKQEIDFEKLISESQAKKEEDINKYISIASGQEESFLEVEGEDPRVESLKHDLTWEECFEYCNQKRESALELYNSQKTIRNLKENDMDGFSCQISLYKKGNKEAFLKNPVYGALGTYAVVKDGEWKGKGEMGWFGSSSNEDESWGEQFEKIIESVLPEEYIVMVDCHI